MAKQKETKTQLLNFVESLKLELERTRAQHADELEKLRAELLGERELRKIDLTELNNASIHNRYLNDELAAMEQAHARAIAVHRETITLLLNHHRYKPRRMEWVDGEGKKLDVVLNPTVAQSVQNHAGGVQSALKSHDAQHAHEPGYGLPSERRSVLKMSED